MASRKREVFWWLVNERILIREFTNHQSRRIRFLAEKEDLWEKENITL